MAAWALPCLLWNLQVDLKITPDRMGLWNMKFTFNEFGRHFSIANCHQIKAFHVTLSLAQLKTLHRSWLYSLNIISCIRELWLLQWSPQHETNEHPCFGKVFIFFFFGQKSWKQKSAAFTQPRLWGLEGCGSSWAVALQIQQISESRWHWEPMVGSGY